MRKYPEHSLWIAQSFSENQVISKSELCDFISEHEQPTTVDFLGGWYCTLPPIMLPNYHITSVDVDPSCQEVWLHDSVTYVTKDVKDYRPESQVVVNTSFEHMQDEIHESIFSKLSCAQSVYLTSNDMYDTVGHVNCHKSMAEFIKHVSRWISVEGSKEVETTKGHKRFMLRGFVK